MKCFVTGATGVLGRRVLKLLVENGLQVRSFARSHSNEKLIRKLGAEPVNGNLFDEGNMIRASEGCNAILHLATAIPTNDKATAADWKTNDLIRTKGTQVLLNAAKINKIDFFLQQSVALLYGNKNGEVVTASTPVSHNQYFMLHSAKKME